MGAIFDAVVQFFEEDEWPYRQMEDRPVLRTGFNGSNGEWACYAQVREDLDQFMFYSVLSAKAPEEKRMAIAEFLTRANYGLRIGNFELDFSDGEIRYKTSIDVENDRLTPALVKTLTKEMVTRTFRSARAPVQPTHSNVSTSLSSVSRLTSTSLVQSSRSLKYWLPAQGCPLFCILLRLSWAASGILLSMRVRLRRISITLKICSIETGHCSWQARQVVQAQISSSRITSLIILSPGFSSAPSRLSTLPFPSRWVFRSWISFLGERGFPLR